MFQILKKYFSFLLRMYLKILAKTIIKVKKPYIIGVTGTAGKTTISRFVTVFLQEEFGVENVWYSRYNYNGEYGLPLTILDAKTWWKSIFGWIAIFFIFLKKIFTKYPKYLVLEYGIDHIWEMDFLLSVATPDIAIVSPIVANHMEQFETMQNYRHEKFKILTAEHCFVHDSLRDFVDEKKIVKISFFGSKNNKTNEIFAQNIVLTMDGTQADIRFNNTLTTVSLPMLGDYQAENILPLFGIAKILKTDFANISKFWQKFILHEGRSGIFDGINNSKIIDGTYNGGYLAIVEGLRSTLVFAQRYRIFVFLGDMRELGVMEKEKHEELAREILQIFSQNENIVFFLVGKNMKNFVKPILEKKFEVYEHASSRMMGELIRNKIISEKSPVLVYAKGSQNTIFLEEGLKKILEKKYHKDLCRQSHEWKIKKEKFFEKVEK